jgi:C-terminal processing protease CtpA/Prc
VFLLLAIVTLAFGLGWGISDLRHDDTTAVSPSNSAPRNGTSTANGTATSAAILDEICNLLKSQYVDRDTIDPATCRAAAINGILTSLNDPHTSYLTPQELSAGALTWLDLPGIGAKGPTGAVQMSPVPIAGRKGRDWP